MCLAVPGKIIAIHGTEAGNVGGATATVDFQGSRLDVGLLMTPEARVGDWVLVHAGFALNTLDEAQAKETWEYLQVLDIEGTQTETQTRENEKGK